MLEQNLLEQMLAGKIAMPEFIRSLKVDSCLQMYVRKLVPLDAINNGQHAFWKRISYEAFEKNQFDFINFLCSMCRFDGSIGDNLNVFSFIKNVYTYTHPHFQCTTQYQEAFDLYLDVVKDCFDGPEVRYILEEIIHIALLNKSKREQRKTAKEAITVKFHLVEKKRPRWIQGPEWPMGTHSPMAFVVQCRKAESVEYHFIDVDTNKAKTVVQFY